MIDSNDPSKHDVIGSADFQNYLERLVVSKYSRLQPADRDDLAQEACLTMLKTTRNVKTPWGYAPYAVPESFRSQERQRKRFGVQLDQSHADPPAKEKSPMKIMEQNDMAKALLAPLLDQERACLIMRICKEYTFHEIRDALNLSSYARARHLFVETLRLTRKMQDELHD